MIKLIQKIIRLKNDLGRLTELRNQVVENSKKLDEIYWGQIFSSAIHSSGWLHNKTFNPGRWAAGYQMLYLLYRILNDVKPQSILEFGLGETTRLTYQYTRQHSGKELTVVEQDAQWLSFFSNDIFNVGPYTLLLDVEKGAVQGKEVWQYKNLLPSLQAKQFNLVVVDGPWGSPEYSRYQIVQMAEHDMLAEDFIILIDDYNRSGERQTVADLLGVLQQKGKPYCTGTYKGIKSTMVICSERFRFLISL